jgi:hypothetical protein
MKNKKPCFDLYCIIQDNYGLIVSWPTGILYSAQCGGVACRHPEYEGFVIKFELPDSFDDCSFGCCEIKESNPEIQERLSKALDSFLLEQTKSYNFKLRFDYSRVSELMEGWWPVLITGKIDFVDDFVLKDHKAILCTGNCD